MFLADFLDALEGNVVEESGGGVAHTSIGDEGTADGNGQSASEGSERGKARGRGSVQMDLSHWLHERRVLKASLWTCAMEKRGSKKNKQ